MLNIIKKFSFISGLIIISIHSLATINANDVTYHPSIPKEHAENITILYPKSSIITAKDKLQIKGVNRYLSDVLINGESLELQENGRFVKTIDLNEPKYNTVITTIILPDLTPLNLTLKALKLDGPEDISSLSTNQTAVLGFLNTAYVPETHRKNPIMSGVSRAELAFFIAKLVNANLKPVKSPIFSDVEPNHWAASEIQYMIDHHMMAEYADGTFRPNRGITKLEYIMTVVRALKLPLAYDQQPLPFSDVDPRHWTTRFVFSGLQHNLLPDTSPLLASEPLTRDQFAQLAMNIKSVSQAVSSVLNMDEGFSISTKRTEQLVDRINHVVATIIEKKNSLELAKIDEPKKNQVIYEHQIRVSGSADPNRTLYINGTPTEPMQNGSFEALVTLTGSGEQSIVIDDGLSKTSQSIVFLPGYDDLQRHWLKKTAAKMKYLGLTPNQSNFEPRKTIDREEFSKLVVSITSMENEMTASGLTSYSDFLIKKDIFSSANSSRLMRRAEAVVAIARLEGFRSDRDEDRLDGSVFKDIESNHWSYKSIAYLFNKDIVSGARKFFPNRLITKAEVVAMLAKLTSVSSKLNSINE